MKRWGLADALGIVVSLVILTYLPSAVDPASFPKLLALTAGGLALAPAVVWRWSSVQRPRSWALLPCGAAVVLTAWVVLATLAADAPWSTRLFGWWLRADGLLGILAALVLLLGAATLTSAEVRRATMWLVGGALVAAVLGLPQVAGIDFMTSEPVTVTSTLGQINFAGAYFAIMAVLTLALVGSTRDMRIRLAWAVAAVALLAMSILTTSIQGPMAFGAGVLAFALAWTLGYRGARRMWAIVAASTVVAVGTVTAILGMLAIGPLGFVGREGNTLWRYAIWDAGWATLAAHPFFGIGTGSFARYQSEFRPLETVVFAGEAMRPSAVHSIPLQFGIVGGWPALVLWIVVFAAAMALLLVRLARRPVSQPWLAAGVAGALGAYLAQAVVSIDTPAIIAVGWVLAGLAIALAREPAPTEQPGPQGAARSKRTGSKRSREPQQAPVLAPPTWVPVAGVVLGLVGGATVWLQISAVEAVRTTPTPEALAAALANPMVPCPVRLELANSSLKGMQIDYVYPVVRAATDVDPRCPPIVNLQSQVALEAGDLSLADSSTAYGTTIDPQSAGAWNLRAEYFTKAGQPDAAAQAQAEVDRINAAVEAGPVD